MARRWRAFHDDPDLATDNRVALVSEEAHHVRRVLRLAVGDSLAVFDGRGAEWVGTIEVCDARELVVRLGESLSDAAEAPVDVTLFQGRSRPERFELVLQKATELGVRAIVALDCERSEGRPADERRLSRWRRMTIEACKQSGRRRLPDLRLAAELPAVAPGIAAFFLDTDSAPVFSDAAAEADAAGVGRREQVWIAVGPESGFSDPERAAALSRGWLPASLGPRVLRTETAGIVATALVMHRWADLGREPAGPEAS